MVQFNLNNFLLFEQEMLDETIAYHGSPYNFDQFDTKFIGTGQGAQAHGWGLYFSLTPNTSFRSGSEFGNTTSFQTVTYKDKTFEKGTQAYAILSTIAKRGKEPALESINTLLKKKISDDYKKLLNEFKGIIEKISEDEINLISLHAGQNYTVDIPDPKTMLREDKPMNKQPKNVKKAFKDIYAQNNFTPTDMSFTGRTWYNDLAVQLSRAKGNNGGYSDELASKELLKYGVPGISYYGYVDKECCVVFSGKDVKIVNKDFNTEKDQLDAIFDIQTASKEDIIGVKLSQKDQLAIIKKRPDLIAYISNMTEKTCLELIKINPKYFSNINKNLQTEKVCKAALEADYTNIRQIDNLTNELAVFAAKINTNALTYIGWNQKIKLTDDDLMKIVQSDNQDFSALFTLLIMNDNYYVSLPNDLTNIMKYILNNNSLATKLFEIISAANNSYCLINFLMKFDFIKEYPNNFRKKIINLFISKFDKLFNYYDSKIVMNICKNLLPFMTSKAQLNILKKSPRLIKFNNFDENVVKKFIQMNPYNIRYLRNPSQEIIKLATDLNPNVKDYIADPNDF